MALHRTTVGQQAAAYANLVRILLIAVAVIAAMLVLTALFGWHQVAPLYQIVPDPAGALGLPF